METHSIKLFVNILGILGIIIGFLIAFFKYQMYRNKLEKGDHDANDDLISTVMFTSASCIAIGAFIYFGF